MTKYTYGNRGFKGFRPPSPSNPHPSPALLIQQSSAPAVILPPERPQLDWLTLKVPYYTLVRDRNNQDKSLWIYIYKFCLRIIINDKSVRGFKGPLPQAPQRCSAMRGVPLCTPI
jgi:hypothetical protein